MNKKTPVTDPHVAAITRALRRASDRALRLSKATRTPFWVVKNGRMVNLNRDTKGGRQKRAVAKEAGGESKARQARTGKAKKASSR